MSQSNIIDLTADDPKYDVPTSIPPPPTLRRSSGVLLDCPVPKPPARTIEKFTPEEGYFVTHAGLTADQLNTYLGLSHAQRKSFCPLGFSTDDDTHSLDDFEFSKDLEIFDSIESKLCSQTDQLSAITTQLNVMQGQLFKLVSAQRKPVVPLAAYARPAPAHVSPFEPVGGHHINGEHPRVYPKNQYKRKSESSGASFSERFNKK